MNFSREQKDVLVPLSIGALVFVALDETIFRAKGRKPLGGRYAGVDRQIKSAVGDAALRKSLIGGAVAAGAAWLVHRGSGEETREQIEKVALPAGAAAGAFIAVNRVSAPFWRNADRRPFAAGAAALAAWSAAKSDDSAVVGRLPVFEPPFPPQFEPPFPPEFEG